MATSQATMLWSIVDRQEIMTSGTVKCPLFMAIAMSDIKKGATNLLFRVLAKRILTCIQNS